MGLKNTKVATKKKSNMKVKYYDKDECGIILESYTRSFIDQLDYRAFKFSAYSGTYTLMR